MPSYETTTANGKRRWSKRQPRPQQRPLFDPPVARPIDPHRPPTGKAQTSIIAARLAVPNFGNQRARLYSFVCGRGADGSTIHEAAAALAMLLQSTCPSMASLRAAGLVRKTAATRLSPSGRPCAVFVAVRGVEGGGNG
jgi:hypothetical protein